MHPRIATSTTLAARKQQSQTTLTANVYVDKAPGHD